MFVKAINRLPKELKDIIEVSSKISSRLGFRVYLVGGIVRDSIIRRESFDYDIVVEGDGIELARLVAGELKSVLRKHHRFGTATVYYKNYKIDVATSRKEYYSRWGNLPKVSPASLVEDLARRDFTINAMAISLNENSYGRLIDPYGGYGDLKNGIIRVMHDNSFLDDPTRMLRAIRFEQRFSFKMDKHTFRLFKEAVSKKALKFVDYQRLRDELILILKENNPPKYIKRIQNLTGFHFINNNLELNRDDYTMLIRVKRAIGLYKKSFPGYRKIEEWILYLMALVSKLSKNNTVVLCRKFRFRRGEEKRLTDYFKHRRVAKYLKKEDIKRSRIYNLLNPLSFETIVFLYAFSGDKLAQDNIMLFLDNLTNIGLNINGNDLKKLGFYPHNLYSRTLRALKDAKIDKRLVTKYDEIAEVKRIFKRIKRTDEFTSGRR